MILASVFPAQWSQAQQRRMLLVTRRLRVMKSLRLVVTTVPAAATSAEPVAVWVAATALALQQRWERGLRASD